jgi:hypothetical protein
MQTIVYNNLPGCGVIFIAGDHRLDNTELFGFNKCKAQDFGTVALVAFIQRDGIPDMPVVIGFLRQIMADVDGADDYLVGHPPDYICVRGKEAFLLVFRNFAYIFQPVFKAVIVMQTGGAVYSFFAVIKEGSAVRHNIIFHF